MTVQAGLCRTWLETTTLVFPRGGSNNFAVALHVFIDFGILCIPRFKHECLVRRSRCGNKSIKPPFVSSRISKEREIECLSTLKLLLLMRIPHSDACSSYTFTGFYHANHAELLHTQSLRVYITKTYSCNI